jgi:hypothetical protein
VHGLDVDLPLVDHTGERAQFRRREDDRAGRTGATNPLGSRSRLLIGRTLASAGELERDLEGDLELVVANEEADGVEALRHGIGPYEGWGDKLRRPSR